MYNIFFNNKQTYKPLRASEPYLAWVVGAKIVRKLKKKQKYWESVSTIF